MITPNDFKILNISYLKLLNVDINLFVSLTTLSLKKSVPFLSKFFISSLNNSLVISCCKSSSIFLVYFSLNRNYSRKNNIR